MKKSRYALIGYISDAALMLGVYESFDHATEIGDTLYTTGLIDAYNVAKTNTVAGTRYSVDALMGILRTWWESCDINVLAIFPKWREWFHPTYLVGACIERKNAGEVKRFYTTVIDVLYELGGYASVDQLSVHLKVNPDSLEKIIKYLRHKYGLPVKLIPGRKVYVKVA